MCPSDTSSVSPNHLTRTLLQGLFGGIDVTSVLPNEWNEMGPRTRAFSLGRR